MLLGSEQLFCNKLLKLAHLTIIGDDDLVLDARVKRFPYSIDGDQSYESYGIHLIPDTGTVKIVKFDNKFGDTIKSANADSVTAEFCCALIEFQLKIFFRPVVVENREQILPPSGFKEKAFTSQNPFD